MKKINHSTREQKALQRLENRLSKYRQIEEAKIKKEYQIFRRSSFAQNKFSKAKGKEVEKNIAQMESLAKENLGKVISNKRHFESEKIKKRCGISDFVDKQKKVTIQEAKKIAKAYVKKKFNEDIKEVTLVYDRAHVLAYQIRMFSERAWYRFDVGYDKKVKEFIRHELVQDYNDIERDYFNFVCHIGYSLIAPYAKEYAWEVLERYRRGEPELKKQITQWKIDVKKGLEYFHGNPDKLSNREVLGHSWPSSFQYKYGKLKKPLSTADLYHEFLKQNGYTAVVKINSGYREKAIEVPRDIKDFLTKYWTNKDIGHGLGIYKKAGKVFLIVGIRSYDGGVVLRGDPDKSYFSTMAEPGMNMYGEEITEEIIKDLYKNKIEVKLIFLWERRDIQEGFAKLFDIRDLKIAYDPYNTYKEWWKPKEERKFVTEPCNYFYSDLPLTNEIRKAFGYTTKSEDGEASFMELQLREWANQVIDEKKNTVY